MFFDSTMVLLIPAIILALYAQAKVRGAYAQFSRVKSRRGYTGARVARELLDAHGLSHVDIEPIPGTLTDHYDPRARVLRLSQGVYRSDSLAAVGVAAHEAGHAVQHGVGCAPLIFRNRFVPIASFGSTLAWPLFFIGLFMGGGFLLKLGVLLFSGAVLFHIVTLPVELNASRRALRMLSSLGILARDEIVGAQKVLTAAAWTYVASAAMAVMQLLRMLMLMSAFRSGHED
ncbi:MAG TPA: zinc metallopeptidase [Candidatus Latescibacteria bacterium]|nr:zinc metallopeptidase [Candidatus Latescibacterota bacterium]